MTPQKQSWRDPTVFRSQQMSFNACALYLGVSGRWPWAPGPAGRTSRAVGWVGLGGGVGPGGLPSGEKAAWPGGAWAGRGRASARQDPCYQLPPGLAGAECFARGRVGTLLLPQVGTGAMVSAACLEVKVPRPEQVKAGLGPGCLDVAGADLGVREGGPPGLRTSELCTCLGQAGGQDGRRAEPTEQQQVSNA